MLKVFIYYSLLVCLPMQAYLYQAVVMRKWLEPQARYHYFIGLGDFHLKHHKENMRQREALLGLLSQSDASYKVVTEDLSVPNAYGEFGCQQYCVNSRGGFLGGITDSLRRCGLRADNLEYRYARVCALGPVFNNRHRQRLELLPSVRDISTHDVAQEIEHACQRLAKYDDGAELNSWYQSRITSIERKQLKYGLTMINSSCSMADFIEKNNFKERQLSQLLTFDCELLDAAIVHETVSSLNSDGVCALAGGSHIERASTKLEEIGYKPLFKVGPTYEQQSLERCLQVEDGRAKRSMPEPIILDQLKRFI